MSPFSNAEERQKWWWLAVGLAFLLLLSYLSPVLAPFLMAAVLAYICLPLVDKMSRRMPRPLAVVLVILLIAAIFIVLLLVILPLFIREGIALAQAIPGWLDSLNRNVAPWINARLGR